VVVFGTLGGVELEMNGVPYTSGGVEAAIASLAES
jgi:hypothetical protein